MLHRTYSTHFAETSSASADIVSVQIRCPRRAENAYPPNQVKGSGPDSLGCRATTPRGAGETEQLSDFQCPIHKCEASHLDIALLLSCPVAQLFSSPENAHPRKQVNGAGPDSFGNMVTKMRRRPAALQVYGWRAAGPAASPWTTHGPDPFGNMVTTAGRLLRNPNRNRRRNRNRLRERVGLRLRGRDDCDPENAHRRNRVNGADPGANGCMAIAPKWKEETINLSTAQPQVRGLPIPIERLEPDVLICFFAVSRSGLLPY